MITYTIIHTHRSKYHNCSTSRYGMMTTKTSTDNDDDDDDGNGTDDDDDK